MEESEKKELLDKFRSKMLDVFDMELKSQHRPVGTIFTELRPNLMLLDHWTLYDSLCNSNFVIAKFKLWTEEGRRELLNFLA
jgi:hypothetical protein